MLFPFDIAELSSADALKLMAMGSSPDADRQLQTPSSHRHAMSIALVTGILVMKAFIMPANESENQRGQRSR
jgi:hypothetical protein